MRVDCYGTVTCARRIYSRIPGETLDSAPTRLQILREPPRLPGRGRVPRGGSLRMTAVGLRFGKHLLRMTARLLPARTSNRRSWDENGRRTGPSCGGRLTQA